VWSFAGATGLVLLAATQGYASRLIEGLPADLPRLLKAEAVTWYTWAALVPAVLAVHSRVVRPRVSGWLVVPAWLAAAAAFLLLHSTLEVLLARAIGVVPVRMTFGTNLFARWSATLVPNLVVFGAVVLAAHAVDHYQELRARHLREAELRAQLAQAQLRALRMQLQPHFLFNTLHTASALMGGDIERARGVLSRLGDLLRMSLAQQDVQEVRLQEEIALLDTYLEIQRARFEDRLIVDVEVAPEALAARVPSLVLQPLVENALRHAVEPRVGPGLVRVRGFARDGELVLEVADDGPGLPDQNGSGAGNGIGLANTRARLEQLYGDRQRLELAPATEGGLRVRVVIPLRYRADG
jgi:sensor histidine kinase YesM